MKSLNGKISYLMSPNHPAHSYPYFQRKCFTFTGRSSRQWCFHNHDISNFWIMKFWNSWIMWWNIPLS